MQRCYKYLPTPLSEHEVMCTAHGPFFTRLQYIISVTHEHTITTHNGGFFLLLPQYDLQGRFEAVSGKIVGLHLHTS